MSVIYVYILMVVYVRIFCTTPKAKKGHHGHVLWPCLGFISPSLLGQLGEDWVSPHPAKRRQRAECRRIHRCSPGSANVARWSPSDQKSQKCTTKIAGHGRLLLLENTSWTNLAPESLFTTPAPGSRCHLLASCRRVFSKIEDRGMKFSKIDPSPALKFCFKNGAWPNQYWLDAKAPKFIWV